MKTKVKKPTKAEILAAAKQVRNELVEIEEIDGFACPDCGALFEDDVEASECCPREPDMLTVYKCPDCGELKEEENEARECCGVPNE